jgi:hypothetical protein
MKLPEALIWPQAVGARLPAMNDDAVCLKDRAAPIAGKRTPTGIWFGARQLPGGRQPQRYKNKTDETTEKPTYSPFERYCYLEN